MLFLFCLCYAFLCACLLIPCGHLLGKMSNCEVVTFLFGILGQMWCLIVSIPDLCPFSYFEIRFSEVHEATNVMVSVQSKKPLKGIMSTYH